MAMVRAGCSNAYFRPQFFTVLLAADLHKLKIPAEFTTHIENRNNNRQVASVFSPLGKFWNIKLIKDGSDTFFKEGWPEFAKFHELEVGFMLVFRYEGNMVFSVKVFGLNGCLKDYNQGAVDFLRRTGFDAEREKSPGKCPSGTEDLSSSGKRTKRKHEKVMEKGTPHCERSNIRDELKTTSKSVVNKKMNKNIISTSHLTHETIMKDYKIYSFLRLPKKFGSVPPNNLEKGEITVKNKKEETWKVGFNTTAGYNNLSKGWREFCLKNGVKIDDTCKLKIVAKNELLVTISKP